MKLGFFKIQKLKLMGVAVDICDTITCKCSSISFITKPFFTFRFKKNPNNKPFTRITNHFKFLYKLYEPFFISRLLKQAFGITNAQNYEPLFPS